jgi:hypothetical protein
MDPIGATPFAEDCPERSVASPTWLLVVASLAVVCGFGALALDGVLAHVIGYALASLLPFTIVAMFRRQSVERLMVVGLPPSREANTGAVLILVIGFLCSVLHAWFIARHLT